jgi:ferredoxin
MEIEMNTEKILLHSDSQKFLDDLQRNAEVLGPTRKAGGTSSYSNPIFAAIKKWSDLEIGYKSSMLSPKKILFPDNQDLYGYQVETDSVRLENLTARFDRELILLGIHPCDIAAISCLDQVFMHDRYRDDVYTARREKTTIIGLTCAEPHEQCFCNIMGAGPDASSGYDLLMTDLGDRFLIKAGTEKGANLLEAGYFKEAGDEDLRQRENIIRKVEKSLPAGMDLKRITKNMLAKYDDDLWKEFADACRSCGACNMVCPTCHCFAIVDKTNEDRTKGRRVIVWDACHFERFTQIAGNISLRGEKSQRYKHRLYDKLLYDPQRYGTIFCVGCGRCAEFCPAHINLLAVLAKLEE